MRSAALVCAVHHLHLVERLVRLRRLALGLVLLHHRKHLTANLHEILHGGEDHLEVLLLRR